MSAAAPHTPAPASDDIATAWQLYQGGRAQHALRLCAAVLARAPNDKDALQLRAVIALDENDLARAHEAAARLVAIAPDDATAHNTRGLVLHRTGDHVGAIAAFETACARDPRHAQAANNLGAALLEQGHCVDAQTHFERALAGKPDFVQAQANLGTALLGQNRHAHAAQALETAARGLPQSSRVHSDLIRALFGTGDIAGAVAAYGRSQATLPDDARCATALVDGLRRIDARQLGPAGLPLLRHVLTLPTVRHQAIEPLARALLSATPCFAATLADPNAAPIPDLVSEPVFVGLLTHSVVTDDNFERLIVQLRRRLATAAFDGTAWSVDELKLACAVALQAFHTDYAGDLGAGEVEISETSRVAAESALRELAPRAALPAAVWAALYRPLHRLAGAEALDTLGANDLPVAVTELLDQTLRAPLQEREIAANLSTFAPIDDAMSRRVKDQYEHNPYPRWLTLPTPMVDRPSAHMRAALPGFQPPAFIDGPLSALIAGCGTGQDGLFLARLFRQAQFIAIDLSRASLAYAHRQAKRRGIANIAFFEGDILDAAAMGQTFDVISCSGVLHHMDAPDAGLRALVGVLRPRGLIHIALYSRRARHAVTAARAHIMAQNLATDTASLRAFRAYVRVLPADHGLAWLTRCADFYYLSGLRDLVFHACEHQYDWPEVAALVKSVGLEPIGAVIEPKFAARYATFAPHDRNRCDFGALDRFERTHSDAFATMFSLWCRKPVPL